MHALRIMCISDDVCDNYDFWVQRIGQNQIGPASLNADD